MSYITRLYPSLPRSPPLPPPSPPLPLVCFPNHFFSCHYIIQSSLPLHSLLSLVRYVLNLSFPHLSHLPDLCLRFPPKGRHSFSSPSRSLEPLSHFFPSEQLAPLSELTGALSWPSCAYSASPASVPSFSPPPPQKQAPLSSPLLWATSIPFCSTQHCPGRAYEHSCNYITFPVTTPVLQYPLHVCSVLSVLPNTAAVRFPPPQT